MSLKAFIQTVAILHAAKVSSMKQTVCFLVVMYRGETTADLVQKIYDTKHVQTVVGMLDELIRKELIVGKLKLSKSDHKERHYLLSEKGKLVKKQIDQIFNTSDLPETTGGISPSDWMKLSKWFINPKTDARRTFPPGPARDAATAFESAESFIRTAS